MTLPIPAVLFFKKMGKETGAAMPKEFANGLFKLEEIARVEITDDKNGESFHRVTGNLVRLALSVDGEVYKLRRVPNICKRVLCGPIGKYAKVSGEAGWYRRGVDEGEIKIPVGEIDRAQLPPQLGEFFEFAFGQDFSDLEIRASDGPYKWPSDIGGPMFGSYIEVRPVGYKRRGLVSCNFGDPIADPLWRRWEERFPPLPRVRILRVIKHDDSGWGAEFFSPSKETAVVSQLFDFAFTTIDSYLEGLRNRQVTDLVA